MYISSSVSVYSRGVRITETAFVFGYSITEPSEILKTVPSVIRCLFTDIRKPSKSNGWQVRQRAVSTISFLHLRPDNLHISTIESLSNPSSHLQHTKLGDYTK
jgi:hypothetical protein